MGTSSFMQLHRFGDLDAAELELKLHAFGGRQALSELSVLRLSLQLPEARAAEVAHDKVLGQRVVFSVDESVFFSGVAVRLGVTGIDEERTCYLSVEVAPELWKLTQYYDSRRHKKEPVARLVSDVLQECGLDLTLADRTDQHADAHPSRSNPVQYDETAYNFLSRHMREEGIFYFVQEDYSLRGGGVEGRQTLVLGDGEGDYHEPAIKLQFQPTANAVPATAVWHWERQHRYNPGEWSVSDFNYHNARDFNMFKSAADLSGPRKFKRGAGFYNKAYGDYLQKRMAETDEVGRQFVTGLSNCPEIFPGRVVELEGHPLGSEDGRYIVTSVEHRGTQDDLHEAVELEYENSFTCVPADRIPVVCPNGGATPLPPANRRQLFSGSSVGAAYDSSAYDDLSYNPDSTDPAVSIGPQYNGNAILSPKLVAETAFVVDRYGNYSEESYNQAKAQWDLWQEWQAYDAEFEAWQARQPPGEPEHEKTDPRPTQPSSARPATEPPNPGTIPPTVGTVHTRTKVVRNDDDEIIDRFNTGEVQVKFHWENAADTNRWLRVAQLMAGQGSGAKFLPRVGDEVIVLYIDGQEKKPLVIGSVYNNPFKLPDEQPEDNRLQMQTVEYEELLFKNWDEDDGPTLSDAGETHASPKTAPSATTPITVPRINETDVIGFQSKPIPTSPEDSFDRGNEFLLKETLGSEQIYVHAQKDFNVEVEDDWNIEVKGDKREIIRGNYYQVVNMGPNVSVPADAETGYFDEGQQEVAYPAGFGSVAKSIVDGVDIAYDKVVGIKKVEATDKTREYPELTDDDSGEVVRPAGEDPVFLMKSETLADTKDRVVGDAIDVRVGDTESHQHGDSFSWQHGHTNSQHIGNSASVQVGFSESLFLGLFVIDVFASLLKMEFAFAINVGYSFAANFKAEDSIGISKNSFFKVDADVAKLEKALSAVRVTEAEVENTALGLKAVKTLLSKIDAKLTKNKVGVEQREVGVEMGEIEVVNRTVTIHN